MKYFITLIILFFSNYCYGQYFEVSNTFSHWHVFGLTNEQKGDSVDLCVLDYNKKSLFFLYYLPIDYVIPYSFSSPNISNNNACFKKLYLSSGKCIRIA